MESKNESQALKPCPVCGAENSHAVGKFRTGNRFVGMVDYFVRCDDCGFTVRGYATETAAIRAWNKEARAYGNQNR